MSKLDVVPSHERASSLWPRLTTHWSVLGGDQGKPPLGSDVSETRRSCTNMTTYPLPVDSCSVMDILRLAGKDTQGLSGREQTHSPSIAISVL